MSNYIEAFEKSVRGVESWHAIEAPSWRNRLKKFIHHPLHYLRYFLYKISKNRPIFIITKTFLNTNFFCYLPDYFWMWDYGILGHASEIKLTRFLLKNLHQGDVVLDIGSNCGFYSVLSSHLVGERGSVHAFEPTPDIYRVLKKNTEKLSNVYPKQVAVFNIDGQANFSINPIHHVANSIISSSSHPSLKTIKVPSVSLDTYCQEFNIRPSFIKLDVEGAEEVVVQGAKSILSRTSPLISLEILEQDGGADYGATEQLIKLGYTPHFILPNGNLEKISFQDIVSFPLGKKNDFENFIFKKL